MPSQEPINGWAPGLPLFRTVAGKFRAEIIKTNLTLTSNEHLFNESPLVK